MCASAAYSLLYISPISSSSQVGCGVTTGSCVFSVSGVGTGVHGGSSLDAGVGICVGTGVGTGAGVLLGAGVIHGGSV